MSGRWAPVVIVAMGVGLAAPALTADFAADDHMHRIMSRSDSGIDALGSRPFDLFVFANGDPDDVKSLIDLGVFPWWTDPEAKLAFMRPLSSASHALDYKLWPDSAKTMLAHNLVWFALALGMVWAFYRRFMDARWLAAFALLLYAIDDAHGPPVGWIANRNAMIALALALPVLIFYDRWRRDGWRPGQWLGPAMLAVALLAGESALAIGAYLAAHAIHLDRAKWSEKLLGLLPYLGVVIVWRVAYDAFGYGVTGSGIYIDPGGAPIEFVLAVGERLPMLLVGQLALPWSDLATLYPIMGDDVFATMYVIAIATLLLIGFALVPVLRADRVSRFFATGMVLAVIPICSTFPGDRLLWFVGLGAMGLMARLISAAVMQRELLGKGRARRVVGVVVAAMLALVHMVASPPFLMMRSRSMVTVGGLLDRANDTIPKDESIRDKTVVIINAPADPFGGYVHLIRESKGETRPARLRWLATGADAVTVERVDERTLRVVPEHGFLRHDMDHMLRSAKRPFKVGERIELTGLVIEIESTINGRPKTILARFDRVLEDPSLMWMQWRGLGYVPYTPPAVGERNTVPAIDFGKLLAGEAE